MPTYLYLLLALAVVGALAYAVYQVTVRQQRVLAEITRLERLTAEVTMSAEALLDEIDERMARLNELAAQLEIRAVAELQARAEEGAGGAPEPEPAPPKRERKGPSGSGKEVSAGEPVHGPADRYGDLRQAVWRLADEGKDAVAIAEALGVPRGEVLLLLNLRGRDAAR